jgi:hypothetical protein
MQYYPTSQLHIPENQVSIVSELKFRNRPDSLFANFGERPPLLGPRLRIAFRKVKYDGPACPERPEHDSSRGK